MRMVIAAVAAMVISAAMADELEDYRQRLQKLLYLLPSFHAQLLTERCRLQAEKDHLEATAAWARSVRV